MWIEKADRRGLSFCLTAVKQALVWPGFEGVVGSLRTGSPSVAATLVSSSSSRLVSFIQSLSLDDTAASAGGRHNYRWAGHGEERDSVMVVRGLRADWELAVVGSLALSWVRKRTVWG